MAAKLAPALVFSLLLALPASATAEHEVYYRYVVLGYVKDAEGAPRGGVPVTVIREKTGYPYLAKTDGEGFYVIIARLGDESAGERLRVEAGALATTIRARFDPRDHTSERGTRLDFLGRRPLERPSRFAATLKRYLAE